MLNLSFTRIVDTNTAIPDGTGNFTTIIEPVIDNNIIAFGAEGENDQQGIYLVDENGLVVIADTDTEIPGETDNFTSFALFPKIDDEGSVVFFGVGAGGQEGVYLSDDSLAIVADLNTPIPEGTGNFTAFAQQTIVPEIDGGDVVFFGQGAENQQGIYADIDGLSLVVDLNTPIPEGTGNFAGFSFFPEIDEDGNIAFLGLNADDQQGVYLSSDGELSLVADTNTAIPDGTGNFTGFGTFIPAFDVLTAFGSIDDGSVVFYGEGENGQEGIYTNLSGELTTIADTNTAIPDGTGNFTSLSIFPAIDDGNIAFVGEGENGQQGIYTNITGSLETVIDLGDELDGSTITNLEFGRNNFNDNTLVFLATLEDGSEAVYTAQVEPNDAEAFTEELFGFILANDFESFLGNVAADGVFSVAGTPGGVVPFSGTFATPDGFAQGLGTIGATTIADIFEVQEVIGNSFTAEINPDGELILTPQNNRAVAVLEEERTVNENGFQYRLDINNFFTYENFNTELSSLELRLDSYVPSEAFVGDPNQIENPDIDPFVTLNPDADPDESVDAVVDFLEALIAVEGDNFDSLRPIIADDGALVFPGDPEILSSAGLHNGEDAIIEAFQNRAADSLSQEFVVEELFVEGNRVIASVNESRTANDTNLDFEFNASILFTVDDEGLVDSIQFIYDTVIAAEAILGEDPFAITEPTLVINDQQVAFLVGSNSDNDIGLGGNEGADAIAAYDEDFNFIGFLGEELVGDDNPLQGVGDIILGADGNILVSSTFSSQVLEFDGNSGEFLGIFGEANATDSALFLPTGLALDADGDIYVAEVTGRGILKYDGETGEFIEEFISLENGGDGRIIDIDFGPDGNLYVTFNQLATVLELDQAEIRVYSGETGELLSTTGDISFASSLSFGQDGRLYVSDDAVRQVFSPDLTEFPDSAVVVYEVDDGQLELVDEFAVDAGNASGISVTNVDGVNTILLSNEFAGTFRNYNSLGDIVDTVDVPLPDGGEGRDADGLSRPTANLSLFPATGLDPTTTVDMEEAAFIVASNSDDAVDGFNGLEGGDALAVFDEDNNLLGFLGEGLVGDNNPIQGLGDIILNSDGNILASSILNARVVEFDGATGEFLGVFGDADTEGSGLERNTGLALGTDGDVYVADEFAAILRFDGETGEFIERVVELEPSEEVRITDITFGPNGLIYANVNPPAGITDTGLAEVRVYDPTTGELVDSVGGLSFAFGLNFGPDGRLYVTDEPVGVTFPEIPDSSVLIYEVNGAGELEEVGGFDVPGGTAGVISVIEEDGEILLALSNQFTASVTTYNTAGEVLATLAVPISDASVAFDGDGFARPTGNLLIPEGVEEADFEVVGPAYFVIPSTLTNEILAYDQEGEFLGALGEATPELDLANAMTFGADGNIYITSRSTDNVLVFDGVNGEFFGTFGEVNNQDSGLDLPTGIKFGPDGNLYVASGLTSRILEYDGETGEFLGIFAEQINGFPDNQITGTEVENPDGGEAIQQEGIPDFSVFVFGPDGNLYVGSVFEDPDGDPNNGTGAILVYGGPDSDTPGELLGIFGEANNQDSGLIAPTSLAFGPDGNLYVSEFNTGLVRVYAGLGADNPGASLGVFADVGSEIRAEENIEEGVFLSGLGFSPAGELFVSASIDDGNGVPASSQVRIYDNTGSFLEVFGDASTAESGLLLPTSPEFTYFESTNPQEQRFLDPYFLVHSNTDPDGFFGSDETDRIAAFDIEGNFLGFFDQFEGDDNPLNGGTGLVTAPNGNILANSNNDNRVLEYDRLSGEFLGVFGDADENLLSGVSGLVVGPDDNVYAVSLNTESVLQFDGFTGEFLGEFVTNANDGVDELVTAAAFNQDGSLFALGFVLPPGDPTFGASGVRIYDGNTGELLRTIEGLDFAAALDFGPNGLLYVSEDRTSVVDAANDFAPVDPTLEGEIIVYDANTEAEINRFSIGVGNAGNISFGEDDLLYLSNPFSGTSTISRYDLDGNFVDVFAEVPAFPDGLGRPAGSEVLNTVSSGDDSGFIPGDLQFSDDLTFTIDSDEPVNLKFSFSGADAGFINEIGFYNVVEGQTTEDIVNSGQVIFSILGQESLSYLDSQGFSDPMRLISGFEGGAEFGFYLVANSTTDAVEGGQTPLEQVIIGNPDTLRVTAQETDAFLIEFEDGGGTDVADFNDLQIVLELTNDQPTVGNNRQTGKELIDLTNIPGQLAIANINATEKNGSDSIGGLYLVLDENGTVFDPVTGQAFLPGDEGYTQAALNNSIIEFNTINPDPTLIQGGFFYAPYLLTDGDSLQFYSPFPEANADGLDHIRLGGDNTFAFEDDLNLGNGDFNDFVLEVDFTVV